MITAKQVSELRKDENFISREKYGNEIPQNIETKCHKIWKCYLQKYKSMYNI